MAYVPFSPSKQGFLVTNSVKQQQFTYFHGEISTRLLQSNLKISTVGHV